MGWPPLFDANGAPVAPSISESIATRNRLSVSVVSQVVSIPLIINFPSTTCASMLVTSLPDIAPSSMGSGCEINLTGSQVRAGRVALDLREIASDCSGSWSIIFASTNEGPISKLSTLVTTKPFVEIRVEPAADFSKASKILNDPKTKSVSPWANQRPSLNLSVKRTIPDAVVSVEYWKSGDPVVRSKISCPSPPHVGISLPINSAPVMILSSESKVIIPRGDGPNWG